MILFRTEASQTIGTGHLMRCLALAEICREQGRQAVFVMSECPAPLAKRLSAGKLELVMLENGFDIAELLSVIRRLQPSAIVIDGYGFDEHYRRSLSATGLPVLAMDDGNIPHPLHADIVLNASPLASATHYASVAPGARLLLGPAYAPLRAEFRHCPVNEETSVDAAQHVLVTFGGGDPLGLTYPVVDALLEALPQQVLLDVVVGGAVADADKIDALARRHGNRIHLHKNTTRMAELMGHAGMAIAAAGSTLWELAYLAIPTLAVVVADNQADALASPLRDWFDTIDARTGKAHAVSQLANAGQVLWHDSEARRQRRKILSRIGVGAKAVTICNSFDETVKRPS